MFFNIGAPCSSDEKGALSLVMGEIIEKLKAEEALRMEAIDEVPQDEEEEEEEVEQLLPEHLSSLERYRKTFYYGGSSTDDLPSTDRFSLPLTEICVEAFNNAKLNNGMNDLFDLKETKNSSTKTIDRLDISKTAHLSKKLCATPTSLMLSLLYLDRLRTRNPAYLKSVASTDLFLISLMVASKYLHDDGEEDEVFNSEWAKIGDIPVRDLNNLEISFLSALDWSIYITPNEYERVTSKVEGIIAKKQVLKRGWTTYTDLIVLAKNLRLMIALDCLIKNSIKMMTLCAAAYAASIMAIMGTICLLNKTPIGPTAVSQSIRPSSQNSTSSVADVSLDTSDSLYALDDPSNDLNASSDSEAVVFVLNSLSIASGNDSNEVNDEKSLSDSSANGSILAHLSHKFHLAISQYLDRDTWKKNWNHDEHLNRHSTSILISPNQERKADLLRDSYEDFLQSCGLQSERNLRVKSYSDRCPFLKNSLMSFFQSANIAVTV